MIRDALVSALESELQPTYLDVTDESHLHSRRTAANPETHFKIIVVSERFAGLTKVKRQQLVYSIINEFFKKGLHALSQATYTPAEWADHPAVNASPLCGAKSGRS